jgi:hypothetical protein
MGKAKGKNKKAKKIALMRPFLPSAFFLSPLPIPFHRGGPVRQLLLRDPRGFH